MEKELLLEAFEKMLLLRRFEECLAEYYIKHKIFSFSHFYTGAESSAAGIWMNLKEGDKAIGNHRSHCHYLIFGGSPKKLAAEMLGRSSGCAKSFGASMHPVARDKGFLGTSPILGSSVPLSIGASFSEKLRKTGNICLGFTGDGAVEESICQDGWNLAAAWELPHITVIENNGWSVLTPVNVRRGKNRDDRKLYEGTGLVYLEADGTDFLDVYNQAQKAVNYARNFQPVILQVFTMRFLAHSTPLKDLHLGHRIKDTQEIMEREDCLKKIRKLLENEDLSGIETKIEKEIQDAIKFAEESSEPELSELTKYVYA